MQRVCSPTTAPETLLQDSCKPGAHAGPMTTTATSPTGLSPIVDRFLDAIGSGAGVPAELFSGGVTLDATVPGWRFGAVGPGAVAHEYSGWFTAPAAFEELVRRAVDHGEVVTYLLTWEERGVPHAAHHCHVLEFDAHGRIARDLFFCGGRWDAALLAEMAAAQHAG